MPSREIRRAKARKGENVSDVVEKKKQLHPFLYGFSILVLVIIVVTFIGSPVAGKIGSMGSIVFGSYEGREISYYPGNYFAIQRDSIAQQMRDSISQSQDYATTAQSIWYSAFRQTALHVALLVHAEQAKLHVSEDLVDKALLQEPSYLEEGRFSEAMYLKSSASERAATRKRYKENLLTDQVISDIFSGVQAGSKETGFITDMARTEKSFSFVSFPFSGFPQGEVRKYGEANKAKFRKIKVSRILVKSSEKEAKEIGKKIAEKTSSFEELAKVHSKDEYAEKGGDMGWRYAYDLEADFEAKQTAQEVFALKAGEASSVLKSTYGWMIFRCDAEAIDVGFDDAAVIEDVKSYLNRYERGKIEDYYNERAGKLSRRSGEIGYDAAVREAGTVAQATDYFPINLQNIFFFAPLKATNDATTPSNAIYSEDFFVRAFKLGKDEVSPPIVLDDQIIVLKRIGERQMPDATLSLMGTYIAYIANQTMQGDLQETLLGSDKLKDNFSETFYKYIYPSQK